MQPDALVVTLKSLKLHGMAQALGELAEQGSPVYQNAQPVLNALIKAGSRRTRGAFRRLSEEERTVPGLSRHRRLRLHAKPGR